VFILFPAFEVMDVFGPLSPLNILSLDHKMNLSLISTNLSAVSTKPRAAAMNQANSTFGESILPTHTFANAPKDLDVLFVPGGLGTRSPAAEIQPHIDFINATYPKLQYLVTVCTGAGLAARAGVLDGRRATTNKSAWNQTTALRPQVHWVSHARWVHDGNIFSGSGVSAAIDTTLAFIEHVYGNDTATTIANGIEYVRYPNASCDPFADLYHLP
jgi:transcriptional regulator GlxA family with amidase domain